MKYYSEYLDKMFDTVEDLEKAEREAEAKYEAEKTAREEAYNRYKIACEEAEQAVATYNKVFETATEKIREAIADKDEMLKTANAKVVETNKAKRAALEKYREHLPEDTAPSIFDWIFN